MSCFIQDLSLNVHSYLDLLLYGSSTSFNNHWLYQQRYHNLLSQKSGSFIWCIKAYMNLNGTEGLIQMDWKNVEKNRKSFGTVLKTCQKYTSGRAAFLDVTGCSNFSKVSLRFKKANSSRKNFQTYSETCIFLCDTIYLKQSMEGTLKVLGKSLKTV